MHSFLEVVGYKNNFYFWYSAMSLANEKLMKMKFFFVRFSKISINQVMIFKLNNSLLYRQKSLLITRHFHNKILKLFLAPPPNYD